MAPRKSRSRSFVRSWIRKKFLGVDDHNADNNVAHQLISPSKSQVADIDEPETNHFKAPTLKEQKRSVSAPNLGPMSRRFRIVSDKDSSPVETKSFEFDCENFNSTCFNYFV